MTSPQGQSITVHKWRNTHAGMDLIYENKMNPAQNYDASTTVKNGRSKNKLLCTNITYNVAIRRLRNVLGTHKNGGGGGV